MNDVVKKWMVDAEAFEMQKLYGIENDSQFNFESRQGDFYITLLIRTYTILQEVKNANYEEAAKKLIDVAQAMLIYSEKATGDVFHGVNKLSNQLYVATIFFLIRYEATASLILHDCDINKYTTESAMLIHYIVSGGCEIEAINNEYVREKVNELKSYIFNGNDDGIYNLKSTIEKRYKDFSFESVDDFFDTAMLVHVIRKFSANNIRKTLININSGVDWDDYIKFSFENHILSFLPSQEDAINKGLLIFNKAFSLKMPTSAGKSYITELVIYQELRKNPFAKILYLAPLRSLSREVKERFEKVGQFLNFTSLAVFGGLITTADQKSIEKTDILISTPEAFMSMEHNLDEQLSMFTLVICDEGQLLEDFSRGVAYELLLTRLKRIEGIRFIFISAIIPNIEDINTWLMGSLEQVGDSAYRPCPIKLACFQPNNSIEVKNESYDETKYTIDGFLSKNEVRGLGRSQKAKASALALKSLRCGPSLLFTTTKGGNMGCASIGIEVSNIIAKEVLPSPLSFSSDVRDLGVIANYVAYQFGEEHSLTKFISEGFAYHHGSLPQDIRMVIEQGYSRNVIPLLICTNTLAEGVNLPIQTLILYNICRYENGGRKALTPSELKNIVGRAGRAGRQRFGLIIYPSNDINKEAYRNIVSALKNSNLYNFKGVLYKVVQLFNNYKDQYNEEIINTALEKVGYAEAIDTMITRSVDIQSLDEVDIEDIVKDSLAYHLGDEEIRSTLTNLFRARYNVLSNRLNERDFNTYRLGGVSMDDVDIMNELLNSDVLEQIDFTESLSESLIDFAISLVFGLPSYEVCKIKHEGESISRKISVEEWKRLLYAWVGGSQYHEIATALRCDVDNAVELVLNLQTTFASKVSAMVKHIETLDMGVNISVLNDFVEMMKRGVDSHIKLAFMKSELPNRILTNFLFNYCLPKDVDLRRVADVRDVIMSRADMIMEIAHNMSIPEISLRILREYLQIRY